MSDQEPKVNPHQKPEPTAAQLNRRNGIGVWVGVVLVLFGAWMLVESVFSPPEWCNAFRCVRDYETTVILFGVGLVVFGGWFAWSSQQKINRRNV